MVPGSSDWLKTALIKKMIKLEQSCITYDVGDINCEHDVLLLMTMTIRMRHMASVMSTILGNIDIR